jgi:uncharacterized SAM-binding protein YcdF (DUF218 family)
VDPRQRARWSLRILALIVASFAVWLAATCLAVRREAETQQNQPADAIVVFGAAQYAGRPSPVFKARLDHAFELFQQGIAPVVITTGGAGDDPRYNEGGVGHDYLMKRGVPEAKLIAETQGSDTAQSAQRVGVIMHANHMESCIAVSDEYHVFRIRKLLEHQHIRVYVAPRTGSRPHTEWQRAMAVLRESLSYMVWRLNPSA